MPENSTNLSKTTESSKDSELSIKFDSDDIPSTKINPDIQRFISDTDPLERVFMFNLCGLRSKYIPVKNEAAEMLGGKSIQKTEKVYYMDSKSAIMNTGGESYLFGTFSPLINQVAQTSSISAEELYHLWRGKMTAVNEALLDSVMEGDPYQYKFYRHPDVLAFLCGLYQMGMKARGGFFLTKIGESFMTIIRGNMTNQAPTNQNESFVDKIVKPFSKVI